MRIGIAPFNILVQQISYTKNIKIFIILKCNIEKVLALKSTINLAKKLSIKYHNFFDILSQADSDILLPHHLYNHKIPLLKKKTLLLNLLYSISQDKLKILKKYLEKNLSKGFIRASFFSTISLVLFACKLRGGL